MAKVFFNGLTAIGNVGDFRDDQRHGRGIFYWRDGTVYRGQFEINKMNGWGVKRQPDGVQEIQHWQDGVLTLSTPIVRQARCELSYLERKWMFDSPTCINALAHGSGVAASLDGQYILLDARFVLGQLVEGRLLELPVDTEAGVVSARESVLNKNSALPVLAGYEIREVIGSGREAQTYLAVDKSSQRQVAVKIIRDDADSIAGSAFLERPDCSSHWIIQISAKC